MLTATAQQPGDAGIAVPTTPLLGGEFRFAELIIEDTGFGGAPGALFATGAGPTNTLGAGAGIGGNGGTATGGASGTVIVLGGNVTGTGGSVPATSGAGAGAGIGGGGGGTPDGQGGRTTTIRVSAGTLTGHGGNSADGGGGGAGVGGGGGGAPNGTGGIPSVLHVTDSGVVVGTGGSSVDGGGGAGIGGGGGATNGAGGSGLETNLVSPATINGTGGTSTNAGGGAGIGGGGGGAGAAATGLFISADGQATVINSGPGASNGGPGGLVATLNPPFTPPNWRMFLTDTIGGRARPGHSYTYLVTVKLKAPDLFGGTFSQIPADSLTVTLALPPGVVVTRAAGDEWACSAGPMPSTVTCAWRGSPFVGGFGGTLGAQTSETYLPIAVKATVAPWVPAGTVLNAVASLTSGYSPAVRSRDTVVATRHHHGA